MVLCGAGVLALPGCLMIPSQPPAPAITRPPVAPTPRTTPPPVAVKSAAYGAFEAMRGDLLKAYPHLAGANGVFAIGVDVSGSCHATGILEYTTKLLTDMCRYFLAPGDKVAVIPWDSRIRESHVNVFDFADSDAGVDSLNASFEDLENLVDPESRGSNLLDARGYCMAKAMELAKPGEGKLCPVVLIFSDIRVPDMSFGRQKFSRSKLASLRKKLAGDKGEFVVKTYQAGESKQIIAHTLAAPAEGLLAAKINRMRTAAAPVAKPRAATYTPPAPRKPRDYSGFRVVCIVFALAGLAACLALPLAWKHKISMGDVRETLRAFGGKVVVQAGRGISPRGVVYLPIPGLEDRPLLAFEGKGPQIIASARRGVRLNDGRTEIAIPMGRPVTLRVSVDGVPGEQELDVQVAGFLATNTGPVIGMMVAFIIMLASIIG